ncbi:hypothetical protein [Wolbachia endosymbiont of Drosophila barbarae]|uniref:hypothetical protein n=1 Tax=Wolbachia endosymbiont of Drosophila barbarae TaxID=3377043 RepID=UPI0037F7CD21
MNFVSNCQFFSLERCNKAIPDWDDILSSEDCSQIAMFVQLCVWALDAFEATYKIFDYISSSIA